ncbi:MAG TPA: hypothetical protein PK771_16030, partial [Spirochaetota bacterium]|nr:hypothetical protein [Spirochaetota bacterium]
MKNILILFLLFLFSLNIFANVDLKLFFNSDEVEKVVSGQIISRMYVKYNAKGENTHSKIDISKSVWTGEDFNKYEILCDEKAFFSYDLTTDTKLKLYNVLTNPNNLSGMEYYSRSASKIEKLIVDA